MELLLLYFVLPNCHSCQRCPRKDHFCALRKVMGTLMPGNTIKYGACYHPSLRTDVIVLLNSTQFIVWRTEAWIEDSWSGSRFLFVSLNLLLYGRSRCVLGRSLSGISSELWMYGIGVIISSFLVSREKLIHSGTQKEEWTEAFL